MEKIAVIVPIYNVEAYLRKCIDSILSQTFSNFKLILVDDGSTDECPTICDEYILKDNRIRVIHKKNGGLSSARNAGIDYVMVRKEVGYLSFVDSDDYIAPTFLEKLYNKMIETNSDMTLCNFFRTDGINLIKTPTINSCNFSVDKYDFDSSIQIVAWNKLYKKKIFEKIRYPLGKLHEDEYVIHRIIGLCDQIGFVEEPLYFYRQNISSITSLEKEGHRILCSIDFLTDRTYYYYFENRNILLGDKYYQLVLKKLIENYRVLSKTNEYQHSFRIMKKIYKMRVKTKIESIFYFSPFIYKVFVTLKILRPYTNSINQY